MSEPGATAPDQTSTPSEGVAPGGGGTVAPVTGSATDGLHQVSGRRGLGLALTLTTVALWSMLPIALKIVLAGMDALTLTSYRFIAAALILGAILASRGTLPRLGSLDASHWRLLAVATLCLAANYIFYVLGLHYTNAGTAQVLIQIAPVLLGLGGIWVFKERFGFLQWTGLVIMVSGLAVFSSDQIAHMIAGLDRYYTGIGFMVVAAVSWAAYGLAQKQLLGRMRSPTIMLCIYTGGSLVFAPMADFARIADLDAAQAGALAFCVVNMLVAYGSFSEALAHLEASRVSAVLATVPLVTLGALRAAEAAMPNLVTPEPISLIGIVGASMVVAGSLMTALGKNS